MEGLGTGSGVTQEKLQILERKSKMARRHDTQPATGSVTARGAPAVRPGAGPMAWGQVDPPRSSRGGTDHAGRPIPQKQPRPKSRHVSKAEDGRRGSECPPRTILWGPRSTERRRRTGRGDAARPPKVRPGERAGAEALTLLPGAGWRCPGALTASRAPRSGRVAPALPRDRRPSSRARGDTARLDVRASKDPGSEASRQPAAGMALARKT